MFKCEFLLKSLRASGCLIDIDIILRPLLVWIGEIGEGSSFEARLSFEISNLNVGARLKFRCPSINFD